MSVLEASVHRPDDPAYGALCAGWNLSFRHHPAAVAQPISEEQVAAALAVARRNGWGVAVQATGHAPTRLATDETLLLDLSAMNSVSIDPGRSTATVGGGAQWTAVLDEAQRYGLAPLLGSAPQVGAVAYSLGGGFGWLARHHGLAVDRVRRLRVVLPDGGAVTATAEENAELFWALLGGGIGSLGVVVEMETELVAVSEVYAGNLLYPLSDAADVFAFHQDWLQTVGDEMTSAFNVTAFPDLPLVPPPLRGQRFAILRGCHSGDPAEGKALIDLWRAWRAPAVDLFGPMPFSAAAMISNDPVDPVPAAVTGRWMHDAGEDTLEAMLGLLTEGSPVLFAELRHAGGAIGQENPAASFGVRNAGRSIQAVAITPGPEAAAEARRRFGTFNQAIAGRVSGLGAYLNFLEGDERVSQSPLAFDDATRQRLAAVKRAVDPEDMFRHGIPLG